jgi:hypothetical protein
MSSSSLRPQAGGRVSMALVSATSESVVYRADLLVPDAEWHGEARIDAAGAVVMEPFAEAPAWLVDYARAFLRGEWRSRQGADAPPWPDRITRWRAG